MNYVIEGFKNDVQKKETDREEDSYEKRGKQLVGLGCINRCGKVQ